jgi:hypothetical protein
MKPRILLVCSLAALGLTASVPSEAAVRCGAHRRAVVRHVRLNDGRRADRVVCVATNYRAPHRSAKKSALVIGGSTAAGAGVGALVGGKKGALIGGIAGGTAGSVYEVKKRHKVRRRR